MNFSRRDLALLLPALANAQGTKETGELPARAYRLEDLQMRPTANTKAWAILKGVTHSKFPIDVHETELPAGRAPHAPHKHVHEELLLIREGVLDVTIAGKTTQLGPGSVAYLASNVEHGWRNAGASPALYFVLALGADAP